MKFQSTLHYGHDLDTSALLSQFFALEMNTQRRKAAGFTKTTRDKIASDPAAEMRLVSPASTMDNFGYRESGWYRNINSTVQHPRLNRGYSIRNNPEEVPLNNYVKNRTPDIDLLERAIPEPGTREYLFVGPSPPAEDAPNMYQSFDVLAPDPEAKLTNDTVRRTLGEMASALGAVRFFDDLECGVVGANDIGDHIRSAPEAVVNLTLLWSAYLTHDELLPLIIEAGADINFHDSNGLSALHLSAFSGSPRGTAYLISCGADVDFAPRHFTPLHCAAFGNASEVAEILIAHGASLHSVVQRAGNEDNLAHCAARVDSVSCLALFLEKGVDPSYATSNGLNALHLAAEVGSTGCLQLLLKETKISANTPTKSRDRESTALHLAAAGGHSECVELLLAEGAKSTAKNYRGFTPLHLAARCSSIDSVEILLRDGSADPNAEDFDKRTPVHAAVGRSERSCDILEMLISWGAKVNVKDEYGYSPVHLAALDGLSNCVETLILLGADITTKSKKGHTALNVIARKSPSSLAMVRHTFDNAISLHQVVENNEEVQLEFDFGCLLKYSYPKEINYLNNLVDEGQKDILLHPLCTAFLYMKWRKIRKYYVARLIFCFLFVVFLSIYVLTALVKTCKDPINSKKYGVLNEICQKESALGKWLKKNPIEMERWILTAITVFEITRKLMGITGYSTLKQYLTTFENLMEWFVLMSVFTLFDVEEYYSWQNHVGGLAVLGAWTNLMLMMGQLPMFGDYVAMYQKVQLEFAKLFVAYACLLFGFTVCFCVVFPNEEMFSNPLMGFISTLSMMVGELNLSIMMNDPEKTDPPLIFEVSSQLIFIMFLMFVTVILMNLLVGIAVHDIQGLRKHAELSKLVRQTKLILFVELGLFNKLWPRFLRKYIYRSAVVSPEAGKVVLSVKPLNPRENRLPRDIMMAAYELAQLNKSKQTQSPKEILHGNRYSKRYDKAVTPTADNNNGFNLAIRGMQDKMDMTTFNLKKIDQEVRHLSILMMELHAILNKHLKSQDRTYQHDHGVNTP